MTVDIHSEKVLILDFGSQVTQLIARRVREQSVYSEIHPYNMPLEKIKEFAPKGIILSGGPSSVYDKDAPHSDLGIYDFDETGEMRLTSLHAGATLDAVRSTIGWDVKVGDAVADTPPPTAAELRLIREELDPGGVYTK